MIQWLSQPAQKNVNFEQIFGGARQKAKLDNYDKLCQSNCQNPTKIRGDTDHQRSKKAQKTVKKCTHNLEAKNLNNITC